MDLTLLTKALNNYPAYKEAGIGIKRINSGDISARINLIADKKIFPVKLLGESVGGKPISIIKAGKGKTKVLLWSQMHGNESTATRAIFDLLNFFAADDELNPLRRTILQKLELNFIPMLNPDGAEKFSRENEINIDINRDAKELQSPEAKILQSARETINPDFCFNLHDQNPYYSVGKNDLSPALSFLAPPFNYENSVNKNRKRGMQIIARLNSALQEIVPGRISKYSDDHEPRSFGDNFTLTGTSVILIESGFLVEDPAKEKIRELNFISLLTAFYSIVTKDYKSYKVSSYFEIPKSEERFFDLLLKNVTIKKNLKNFKVDIGIKVNEKPVNGSRNFYYEGTICEIGDLSTMTGHKIVDCTGLTALEGKIFKPETPLKNELKEDEIENLLNEGFTTVILENYSSPESFTLLPINISRGILQNQHSIAPDSAANLILSAENGLKFAVVNGHFTPLPVDKNFIRNGVIFP